MSDSIEEALVYAIALGQNFALHEPLPGKAKKKVFKALAVPHLYDPHYAVRQRAEPLAYFIASQFCDRKISLDGEYGTSAEWTVADGRSGAYLRFSGPSESKVLSLAREASVEKVDPKLSAFDAAVARLTQARLKQETAIVHARQAAWSWPPAKDSKEAQALELASKGVDFRSYPLKPVSIHNTSTRKSSKAAFVAKLKDPSFHLCVVDVEDRQPRGYEKGSRMVFTEFCASDDPNGKPFLVYDWVILPSKEGEAEGQKPVAASEAKAKSR